MYREKINIKNYKVFVFDLDNTLYLRRADLIYRKSYNIKIKQFLKFLKDNGKIVCLATHNKSPYKYLFEMDIYDIFQEIIYETRNVSLSKNTIREYTNKKDMIQEILQKTNVSNNDIVFFDDVYYNINQVNSLDIDVVLVSPEIGIIIEDITC
jgi:HAD superfamily phosphatase (TIGR01681 family)